MTHPELAELYELYAMGVLEGEERAEIERHLSIDCQECRAGIGRALAFNSLLGAITKEAEPPAALRRRVLAQSGYEERQTGVGWFGIWVATTLLLLVGMFFLVTQERTRTRELAQSREETHSVRGYLSKAQQAIAFLDQPETKQVSFGQQEEKPPRGNVFMNSKSGVLMIANNLPEAPHGKLYELWLIPKDGPPRPSGLFQANSDHSALYVLAGPVDLTHIGTVAVTLESERGSPVPTSAPIIAVTVGS